MQLILKFCWDSSFSGRILIKNYTSHIENEIVFAAIQKHVDEICHFVIELYFDSQNAKKRNFLTKNSFTCSFDAKSYLLFENTFISRTISLHGIWKRIVVQICIFLILVYIKTWFPVPLAYSATKHDFNLIKLLHN